MENFTIEDIMQKKQANKKIIDKDEQKRLKLETIEKELESVEYLESYEPEQKDSVIETTGAFASNNFKRNGDDKIASKGFRAYADDLLKQANAIIKAQELGVLDTAIKLYHTPKK